MKHLVVYTKDSCPNCEIMKERLKREGTEYIEVNIGKDITREEFLEKYPTVRSVPHLAIEDRAE